MTRFAVLVAAVLVTGCAASSLPLDDEGIALLDRTLSEAIAESGIPGKE